MKAIVSALALAVAMLGGNAASADSMDVVDFLVDWKSLMGQTVTVTGCTLAAANYVSVWCHRGKSMSDEFLIDGETLARDDLRRAMRNCDGFFVNDGCAVDVTGVVAIRWEKPELINAAFTWKAVP